MSESHLPGSARFDVQVKLAVYGLFAETGERPSTVDVAGRVGSDAEQVLDAYHRLRGQRVLALKADGASIRMAPPFSGVPTQHIVEAGGKQYFANCAWDALRAVSSPWAASTWAAGSIRSTTR